MSPDDVAAAAERARRTVDIATWVAVGLGLAFTAVNVQAFAAGGAPVGSPGWSVAWLLDPMVSILLLAVVRAEQVTARWQLPMPWQVWAVKWAAFAATYAMNTWSAWRDGVPSSVVLHSVPPVFVLLAAEVAPALRDRLSEAVARAEELRRAMRATSELAPAPALTPADPGDLGPSEEHGNDDGPEGHVFPAQPARSAVVPCQKPSSSDAALELAGRLAAGEDLTGSRVAVERGCSERNARRLLAEARRLVVSDAISDNEPELPLGAPHLGLTVVGRSS